MVTKPEQPPPPTHTHTFTHAQVCMHTHSRTQVGTHAHAHTHTPTTKIHSPSKQPIVKNPKIPNFIPTISNVLHTTQNNTENNDDNDGTDRIILFLSISVRPAIKMIHRFTQVKESNNIPTGWTDVNWLLMPSQPWWLHQGKMVITSRQDGGYIKAKHVLSQHNKRQQFICVKTSVK